MKIRGKIRRNIASKKFKLTVSLASVLAAAVLTGQVFAAPIGGNVVTGTININDPSNIAVTNSGIINWQSFNIAANEAVNFNFLNANTAVLNRVTGGTSSSILGTISSSGNVGTVFLANPAGIIFGNGAQINVPSFLVTTFNVSDNDFLSMVNNGGIASFTSGNSNGKIQINGLTLGTASKNVHMFANSIEVAPGVTITNTATNSQISLVALDNTKISLHDGFNEIGTNAGNTVTVGAGSTISAANINIYGNTINFSGTAANPVKITPIGNRLYDVTTIAAFNNFTKIYDAASKTNAVAGTATSANTVNISYTNIGTPGNNVTSKGMRIYGGKVAIDNSTLSFGGTRNLPYGADDSTATYKLGNEVKIVAGNSFVNTSDDDTGMDTSIAWTATKDNTVDIISSTIAANQKDGAVLEVNRVELLGGKVNVGSSTIKAGEFFAGAGSSMSLEKATDPTNSESKYWDEYYFSDTKGAAANGQTVNFDANTKITTTGEAAVYANAITNSGTITATNQYGVHFWAFNNYSMSSKGDEVTGGTIETGAGSIITNNGSITTSQLDLVGSKLINNGTITIADGGKYGMAVLTDQMTGNKVQVNNITGTIIEGKNDPNYDANKLFNRITFTPPANFSFSTIAPSNTDVGTAADIINSTESVDNKKKQLEKVAASLSNSVDAVNIIDTIQSSSLDQTGKNQLFQTVIKAYAPTQSQLRESTGQLDAATKGSKGTANAAASVQKAETPAVASTPVDSGVTVAPAAGTKESGEPKTNK